jgi:hypothetical protein
VFVGGIEIKPETGKKISKRLVLLKAFRATMTVICTENSIRVDHVSESPNVGDDDRAVLPLPGTVRLAVQVEEPT